MSYNCISRSREGSRHLALGGCSCRCDIDELRILTRIRIKLSTLCVNTGIFHTSRCIRLNHIHADRGTDPGLGAGTCRARYSNVIRAVLRGDTDKILLILRRICLRDGTVLHQGRRIPVRQIHTDLSGCAIALRGTGCTRGNRYIRRMVRRLVHEAVLYCDSRIFNRSLCRFLIAIEHEGACNSIAVLFRCLRILRCQIGRRRAASRIAGC